MTLDKQLLKVFPKPPMVAYKQPPNLKRVLCHAKLPSKENTRRKLVGMQPCNNLCIICPYVNKTKETVSTQTKRAYPMTGFFNCNSKGVVYVTTCNKCGIQYVGQTKRTFKERMKEHLQSIQNNKEVTGKHYNEQNHSHHDLKVQVVEKVIPNTPQYRLEREDFWIRTLNTKNPLGLNKYD